MAGRLKHFWFLIQRAFLASIDDNILLYAKSASYSGLLSFIPLVGTLAALLFHANAAAVSQVLAQVLGDVTPPGTEALISSQFNANGERPISLLVGAGVISLWSASSVLASLMEGFDACYRIPVQRSFWQQRWVALALVLVSGIPVVMASSLIVFGEDFAFFLVAHASRSDASALGAGVQAALTATRNVVGFVTSILVTTVLFYFGPNKHVRWRDAFPGAMVATALWYLTVIVFAWYVRNIAHYNVAYGSLGAGIALLVWMFAISVIALYGCEFNAEIERLRRPKLQTGSHMTASAAGL